MNFPLLIIFGLLGFAFVKSKSKGTQSGSKKTGGGSATNPMGGLVPQSVSDGVTALKNATGLDLSAIMGKASGSGGSSMSGSASAGGSIDPAKLLGAAQDTALLPLTIAQKLKNLFTGNSSSNNASKPGDLAAGDAAQNAEMSNADFNGLDEQYASDLNDIPDMSSADQTYSEDTSYEGGFSGSTGVDSGWDDFSEFEDF